MGAARRRREAELAGGEGGGRGTAESDGTEGEAGVTEDDDAWTSGEAETEHVEEESGMTLRTTPR